MLLYDKVTFSCLSPDFWWALLMDFVPYQNCGGFIEFLIMYHVIGAISTIITDVTANQQWCYEHNALVSWERWSPWTATSVRVGHGEAPGPKNRLNWPSRLGVGTGLTTHYRKKTYVTETSTSTQDIDLVERESSDTETMTCAGETRQETNSLTTLLTTKSKIRLGTWNIRTLYESSRCAQVNREMQRYNLQISWFV